MHPKEILMKYIPILISLIMLNTPALAADVDFSNGYVIPLAPLPPPIEGEFPPPPTLQVGGVKTTNLEGEQLTTLYWILSLGFNPDNITFQVVDAFPQNPFDPEMLQQRLRDTVWLGDYRTSKNLYSTELEIKSVQAGFVGGEIKHFTLDGNITSPIDEEKPSNFLTAKVVGDITTQYLIDEEGDGVLVWVEIPRYQAILVEINEENAKNEGKEDAEIIPAPAILDSRQLIQLKRAKSIGQFKNANSRWGSHNEYRFTLENDRLFGSVGTPPDSYGSENALTGVGEIELFLEQPEDVTPEPPAPE
jgi:hypothetical protein